MQSNAKCLLRNLGNPEFCSPLNALYISLHGHNGKGGRVANANVPEDYRGVLLVDSPAREGQANIYEKLDKYAESFTKQFDDVRKALEDVGQSENQIRIKSLYLWSRSPGTGKTTSASALLNEYLLTHYLGSLKRRQTPKQRPAYFLDVNGLQTLYNEFNRPRVPDDIAEPAARRYYTAIERAKLTDFVVCDDIGVRDATDGFRGDLHSVIDYRVTNALPTVYTSNIPIEELPLVFGEERLADRIKDMTATFEFRGTSKRGARK